MSSAVIYDVAVNATVISVSVRDPGEDVIYSGIVSA